jgi:signal transduction histidine kinase
MSTRKHLREESLRWSFVPVSLVVPLFVVSYIFVQGSAAVPEFRIDALEQGMVREVIRGGGAEQAGVRAGDVIRAVDGIPFESYDVACHERRVEVGESARLRVERDGRLFTLRVPFVPVVLVALTDMVAAAGVALGFWGASAVLLWRRIYRTEVRLLFFLAQAVAIGLLLPPLDFLSWYHCSNLLCTLSTVGIGLSAPLLFHFHITFPVILGTPRRRRWVLGTFYGAVVVAAGAYFAVVNEWLFEPVAVVRASVACFVLELLAAIAIAVYVYFRRAGADHRRRLRLMVASVFLASLASAGLYVVPAGLRGVTLVPEWIVRLLLLVPPLAYGYSVTRQNLFGIDRLLNRALVYGFLSLSLFALYLGPLLLVDRVFDGTLLARTMIVAGLTLLIGLSFNWTRTRVQRFVDRLFYGGWYDYPAVVETVSDALAGSLRRDQLTSVLTDQVPHLMHLDQASLWIGEPEGTPAAGEQPQKRRFPLRFRGRVRGMWTVGKREDGDPLSTADQRILATLARQAEVALSNVLLVETLQDQLEEIRASRETLARAQRRLLHSREEERTRLARELHDGPLQALVGLKLELDLLLDSPVKPRSRTAAALEEIRGRVQGVLAELRQVCAQLRPPVLDTLGLGVAVQALVDDWSAQYTIPVELERSSDGALRSLEDSVAVNLYRVVQESLNNVARHAAAQRVRIRLVWEAPRLILTVQDDGRGFVVPDDFDDVTAQGHFGLVGIEERVDLIGGAWDVVSAPGQGTEVRVVWRERPPHST